MAVASEWEEEAVRRDLELRQVICSVNTGWFYKATWVSS